MDANANIPKRPDELLSSLGQPVDTSEMQRITQVCQGVITIKEFHVKLKEVKCVSKMHGPNANTPIVNVGFL